MRGRYRFQHPIVVELNATPNLGSRFSPQQNTEAEIGKIEINLLGFTRPSELPALAASATIAKTA
ncbi:Uu.00g032420.m01.CDS01 [Anthostomella pinea]|uniref:Uu.00g032420.m01.CDS01 n=1 Tax=Anthostomella pinea TaxID=933095 RepID=A0AAI8V8P1_9PEZI|nr:Uu.00g032420.m01.CDS01 [Anthostomella pinea]